MMSSQFESAIAITGMACRFPGSNTLEEYWNNLCAERSGIRTFDVGELRRAGTSPNLIERPNFIPACGPIPEPHGFDAAHFGISNATAQELDLQHRSLLECSWSALEAAGVFAKRTSAVGVFAGCSDSRLDTFARIRDRDQSGTLAVPVGASTDYLASRLAYVLDLQGPVITARAACATSVVAIHLAVSSLLANECDAALAAAVAIRHPLIRGHLYDPGGMYSSDALCRPYDHRASGIISGDGVGAVVLRRLADAIESGDHIHAVILASAINNDGARKASFAAPSFAGQVEAALTAFEIADIDPGTIGFIEGHGTGTPLGDPIEIAALCRVWDGASLRDRPCVLGSVKSNIGHLDAASGIAGLIKATMAVERGIIPATLNFEVPNPQSELAEAPFVVRSATEAWGDGEVRRASLHSLGMGGTNGHIIVEQFREVHATRRSVFQVPEVLLLSVRRAEGFRSYADTLASSITANNLEISRVATTLASHRSREPWRRALVVEDAREAARDLAGVPEATKAPDKASLVVAFSADGTLDVAGIAALRQSFSAMELAYDDATRIFKAKWGLSLDEVVRSSGSLPIGVLPATVAIGYALHALCADFGAGGDVLIGQSLGEVTAAAAARMLSLEDVLDFAMVREEAFRAVAGSGATAVGLSVDELRDLLPPEIEIAVVNSPKRCVVSGPEEVLASFERTLSGRDIPARRLPKISAVHSSLLEPVRERIVESARSLRFTDPRRTFISTLTPEALTREVARQPDHWGRHFRETVRYDLGLRKAVEGLDNCVVLDIGPAIGSTSAIREAIAPGPEVFSIFNRADGIGTVKSFANALGRLWERGVEIDWKKWPLKTERCEALPAPPLVRIPLKSFGGWIDPDGEAPVANAGDYLLSDSSISGIGLWQRTWSRVDRMVGGSPQEKRIRILGASSGAITALVEQLTRRGCAVDVASIDEAPLSADIDLVIDATSRLQEEAIRAHHSLLNNIKKYLDVCTPESAFVVLTEDAFDVVGDESPTPVASSLSCVAVIAAQENADRRIFCVDLNDGASPANIANALETLDSRQVVRAVRNRTVWTSDVRPLAIGDNLERSLSHCLITGGTGRFGRWVARWLSENGCKRLHLVGRTAKLSAETIWALEEIRRNGCDVDVECCDVGNKDQFTNLLDRVFHGEGQPTVFHLAGALNGNYSFATVDELANAASEAVQEQWHGKVDGALALHAWCRRNKAAKVVLFSSSSAILGGPGLAAYASANAALDCVAQRARIDDGLDWTSISWDGWRLPDDQPTTRNVSSELEEVALSGSEPWRLLIMAFSAKTGHVVASKGDLRGRYRKWIAALGDSENTSRVDHATRQRQPDTESAGNELRSIWTESVGFLPQDDVDLFEAGGDSLTALRIRSQIERRLGVSLTLRQILDNRTIASMVQLIRSEAVAEISPASSDAPVASTTPSLVSGRI